VSMMKAAVLLEKQRMELQDWPIPVPKRDEALIRVKAVGICGSDIHYFEHGEIGRYKVEQPLILGHEVSGEVVEVGADVTTLKVGDRVAIEPGVTCGRCQYCKAGRYNLCPKVVFMATPPHHGAWAEYVAVREDFLFKLPEALSFEVGALLEPLSVGVHAMKRGRLQPGERVVISGLGPVGLLAIAAAQIFQASEIIGIDPVALRREMAQTLGCTRVVNPFTELPEEIVEEVTRGEGFNAVFETSGSRASIESITRYAARGGRIVQVGLPTQNLVGVNVQELVDKELDYLGVFRYVNTYPFSISNILSAVTSNGSPHPIEQVITHRFPLTDVQEAIRMASEEKDQCIKVMIYP
jgi:L-iditol 2-dehydrogenase